MIQKEKKLIKSSEIEIKNCKKNENQNIKKRNKDEKINIHYEEEDEWLRNHGDVKEDESMRIESDDWKNENPKKGWRKRDGRSD